MKDLQSHIDYLKNNCDEFVTEIHNYMVGTNWTWYDSAIPPSVEKIKKSLFNLLDELHNANQISTGGFLVLKNEKTEQVEVYFGKDAMVKKGIKLCSPSIFSKTFEFAKYLCDNTPAIDRQYVMDLYDKFINDDNTSD